MYTIVRGSTSGADQRCACHTDQDPQLSGSFGSWCVLAFCFGVSEMEFSYFPIFPWVTSKVISCPCISFNYCAITESWGVL